MLSIWLRFRGFLGIFLFTRMQTLVLCGRTLRVPRCVLRKSVAVIDTFWQTHTYRLASRRRLAQKKSWTKRQAV